jgi:histidinol dehydrogenase
MMGIQIRQLDSTEADFKSKLSAVLAFEASEDEAIDRAAATILADIKSRGDVAVLEYTNRFDRLTATSVAALEVSQAELQAALAALPEARRVALQTVYVPITHAKRQSVVQMVSVIQKRMALY